MPSPSDIRVMSLDLSLACTGATLVRGDWGGDWNSIARGKIEPKLPRYATEDEKIERLIKANAAIVTFAREHRPTHLVIEQYAYGMATRGQSHGHSLAELGGLVKAALHHGCGLSIEPFTASTARKLLLGKLPPTRAKKGQPKPPKLKTVVFQTLRSMGMPEDWGEDEADSFVGANWKLSELGGYALALPPPPEEPKRRRRAA